jgi:type I restriction enzyme S subunit
VRRGDVVMAIVGATTGKSAIVRDVENVSVQRSIAILRPRQNYITSMYLNYWLQSTFVQNEIRSIMDKYAAQPGIYLEDVAAIRIPAISMAEQSILVPYLDSETAKLDTLVAKICAHIEKVREYRAALISAAVTGKIDVRDQELVRE